MLGKRKLKDTSIAKDGGKDSKATDVDASISNSEAYKVCNTDGDYHSKYLMKADCEKNNNKFYILQVI